MSNANDIANLVHRLDIAAKQRAAFEKGLTQPPETVISKTCYYIGRVVGYFISSEKKNQLRKRTEKYIGTGNNLYRRT